MKQNIVEQWLKAVGAKEKKGAFSIENECTLMLRLGEDLVTFSKVKKVTFHASYIELVSETERLFAPENAIEVLKVKDTEGTEDKRAGFH